MSTMDPSTTDLLYPLSAFDRADDGGVTSAQVLEAEELPQPYRMLLAHDRDMTGTLETYFSQPVTLKVYSKRIEGDKLYRQVVLQGEADGKPKEFGAICIDLSCFDDQARAVVADCRVPLGRVLREYNVAYVSNPSAYLSITPSKRVLNALHADAGPLFGRKNELTTPEGITIAHIIEVLPQLPEHKE